MQTAAPHEPHLAALSRIRRVPGRPGDPYEVIFLDQRDRIVVPLTEWYRLRKAQGPASTRSTYLTHLLPYFTFLVEKEFPWNAPPERLRPILLAFHRDRLCCQVHPTKDRESFRVIATRDTPVCESTLRVIRAAMRDFYLVMKDEGLYPFPNPLSSEVLVAMKREYTRALANRGAPEQAGIRQETREQSRRLPTAFLRSSENAESWKPELRKELSDVREGIHAVLNAMLDSAQVSSREKAILQLLQNTGARLHEVVLMTVGGYRNEGIAGQANVVNKGSYGREAKTIYFEKNPLVQRALTTYIEQVRPLHDPLGRKKLTDIGPNEPFFLTERGSAYGVKAFYYHWYKHYAPLRGKCPVPFSPHDIRHLFITEYLIWLKHACGAGTDQFDSERYLREREAFGLSIMGWRSAQTIDIYDHTRSGEGSMYVLGDYQHGLSEGRYMPGPLAVENPPQEGEGPARIERQDSTPGREEGTVWMHDPETLAWIKRMEQQARTAVREERK